MKPVTISARDGLTLHSYLTVPDGVEAAGLPLVLDVHGRALGQGQLGI